MSIGPAAGTIEGSTIAAEHPGSASGRGPFEPFSYSPPSVPGCSRHLRARPPRPGVQFGIQDDAWLFAGPGTFNSRLRYLQRLGVDLVRVNVRWNDIALRRPTRPTKHTDRAYAGSCRRAAQRVAHPRHHAGRDAHRDAEVGERRPRAELGAGEGRRLRELRLRRGRALSVRPPLADLERAEQELELPADDARELRPPAQRRLRRDQAHQSRRRRRRRRDAPRGGTGDVSPVDWIHGMQAAGARLDAYAHHPYPIKPKETPWAGGCDACPNLTMASLDRLIAEVSKAFGSKTRIWLTEYGYQTNPPESCSASPRRSRRGTSPSRRYACTARRRSTCSSTSSSATSARSAVGRAGSSTSQPAEALCSAFPIPIAQLSRKGPQVTGAKSGPAGGARCSASATRPAAPGSGWLAEDDRPRLLHAEADAAEGRERERVPRGHRAPASPLTRAA